MASNKSTICVILVIVAVVAAIGYWSFVSKPAQTDRAVSVPRTAENSPPAPSTIPAPPLPSIPFTDITKSAGIDFVHVNGADGDKLLPETMGSGAAFLDYDNDGDQDLLLINAAEWSTPTASSALYQNDGSGRFRDVTDESGLRITCYGTGVAVGDFDNDGWRDVFIAALGADHLFRNQQGRFTKVTETAGVAGDAGDYSSSCGWFDYDGDGDLDLCVCRYVDWSREADLAQEFTRIGGERDYGPPLNFGGTLPRLYRNEGEGRFRDVSEEAGLEVRSPGGAPLAKSLGLMPVDIDGDGWLDLIVANDTVRNLLFRNQQDGTFEEIGIPAGIAFDNSGNARGAMGIDAVRFRNDDSLGVAIGNFANEMTALYVSQRPLLFSDEAIVSGLGAETLAVLTFGLFFFDADLDGRLDLLAANGHVSEQISRVQTAQTHAQPPQLFWNTGDSSSAEFLPLGVEQCGEDFVRTLVGRGAAYADIDGDGDLDVVITTPGGPPRLLRNDQQLGHHWLRLKLIGTQSNRDAIGSLVQIRIGDQVQSRTVMPTRSYLSQMELPVTFGLGETEAISEVTVTWPNGDVQTLNKPEIDRLHTVRQSPP